jgi:hypothetical protein
MLPQSKGASDEANSFYNEKDCKNQGDHCDARRDANKQSKPRCDADDCEKRLEGTVRDLLAEERHEQGDCTAYQRKCSQKLCNHHREEQRGTNR